MHPRRAILRQTSHYVSCSVSAIQKNHSSSFQASCNTSLFFRTSLPIPSIDQAFLQRVLPCKHVFHSSLRTLLWVCANSMALECKRDQCSYPRIKLSIPLHQRILSPSVVAFFLMSLVQRL